MKIALLLLQSFLTEYHAVNYRLDPFARKCWLKSMRICRKKLATCQMKTGDNMRSALFYRVFSLNPQN
jgi:hypothetical protein